MFKYKVGTVRLFGTQENLSLTLQGLEGNVDAVLTEEYLQFIVPKTDIAEFSNIIENLCDEGQYLGAVIWEGLHYGEPCEKYIFSWNSDNWNITRDTLKNSGYIKEYFAYKNSAEYAQEKKDRQIRKVEKVLSKLSVA